jgi:hypothetical protein
MPDVAELLPYAKLWRDEVADDWAEPNPEIEATEPKTAGSGSDPR